MQILHYFISINTTLFFSILKCKNQTTASNTSCLCCYLHCGGFVFLIPICYFNLLGSIFFETIIANIMEISKYTWAETPTQITEQKKTLKSKPVWGMLLTKSNQNSSRILHAVHKQASPFSPIKFYIFFPVGNFVFNIPYISLMLWLKAKTAAV